MNLEEAFVGKLFRCARDVPGTDWKGISVQAKEWYSPASPKKRKKEFETEILGRPAT